MVDHGIHVPGAYKKTEPRLAQNSNALLILPVRLRNHTYLIAVSLQNTADDGVSKGRMIHVGVPADIDEITLTPAPFFHIFPADRKKIMHHGISLLSRFVMALSPCLIAQKSRFHGPEVQNSCGGSRRQENAFPLSNPVSRNPPQQSPSFPPSFRQ